jgi:large subunit ribosomal protein L3
MAGQMGNATASILNLEVIEILADDNAVVISGAVPGPDGAIVMVHHAARPRRRSRIAKKVAANA